MLSYPGILATRQSSKHAGVLGAGAQIFPSNWRALNGLHNNRCRVLAKLSQHLGNYGQVLGVQEC